MMYWPISYLAGVLATLMFVTFGLVHTSKDFPIGIALGTNYLTAAYIIENDNFVTAASVETTTDWKDFSRSLLKIERDDSKIRKYTESEANKLLNATLFSISQATEAKLNRRVEVWSIACPDYLDDAGYCSNLRAIAFEILPGMYEAPQVRSNYHCIERGYRLDNAKALGYPDGTNIDLEDSLILHFEYQDSLLRVVLTSLMKDTTTIDTQSRLFGFGGVKQVASPEGLEDLIFKTKALVNNELSRTSNPPVRHTNFKAIIFSGDAPASEFKKIKEAIIKAVPELSDRIREDIEPGWAAAVGAARRAKEYKLNPPVWVFDDCSWPEDDHDEL